MIRNHSLSFLFKETYPNINIVPIGDMSSYDKIIHLEHRDHSVSLQQVFAKQLGFFDAPYLRPIIDKVDSERPFKNKYVCISTHSTAQMKFWNHKDGVKDHIFSSNWNEICKMLRKSGYTPVCVDFNESFGVTPFYNYVPTNSVKKLGLSLTDVIKILNHCEFFIGLSSGLTWLAHSMNKPVCMISNFTEDWYEIDLSLDDYIRITNKNVCHGCWNLIDNNLKFDYNDWYWCPNHKNSENQFICHTSITPQMVFEKIQIWME